jgi:hypothetical protein
VSGPGRAPATVGSARVLFEAEKHSILVDATGDSALRTPAPDVSKLAGAKVVAWIEREDAGSHTIAGCIRGPSDRFAPGIEDVLFERATWLAQSSLGVQPRELAATSQHATATGFDQVKTGKVDRGAFIVAHVITFDGEARDLLLCSVACEGVCDGVTLSVEGEPPPVPPPNVLIRSFLWAAERPRFSLGALGALVLLVTAVILWRRPRPRP